MMLTRVPTLLSIHQFDSEPASTSILAICQRAGTLPLMRYSEYPLQKRQLSSASDLDAMAPEGDSGGTTNSDDDDVLPVRSLLDTVLVAKWEDRFVRGLFRYDVTACPTKTLPGVYGFVAQLNEGRATKKRATEFSIDQVVQPFDPAKFNFTKADEAEVLLQFEAANSPHCSSSHGSSYSRYVDHGAIGRSPNLVVINVSPIEYGHVLLVPRVLSNLPQQLTHETVTLALHFAAEGGNPYFRVGYNSLGAYATINHLHFQAYFLTAPFAIERAPTVPLAGSIKGAPPRTCCGGVRVKRLSRFPVRTIVFELGDRLGDLGAAVAAAAVAMQESNVPFNMLITDCGARVFLIPQCFAAKVARGEISEKTLETGINPAVFEIAGHLLYKRQEDYDAATQDAAWALLSEASLTDADFNALVDRIVPFSD